MNQPHKVRLKPKTKMKFLLMITGGVGLFFSMLWILITSALFKQNDVIRHKNFIAKPPESCRYHGKYHRYKCKFLLKPGVLFEVEVARNGMKDGTYCIGEVHKNGKFTEYTLVTHEKCV